MAPQLFLDDFLIDRLEGLERRPEPPERSETPVLDSARFGCTQPYVTVLRESETGHFRLWYNRGPAVWHAESDDGVRWANPRVAWDLPRGYGASLVDHADRDDDPARRDKLANWQATRAKEDRPGDDAGMYVGFSPDGLRWTAYDRNPVLPTWPEGYGKPTRHDVGDIVDVAFDPLRGQYVAAVKLHAVPEDGYAPGPRAGGYPPARGVVHQPGFPPLGAAAAHLRAGWGGPGTVGVLRDGCHACTRRVAHRHGTDSPRRPALRPRGPEGRDRLLSVGDQPGRPALGAPSRAVPGPQPRAGSLGPCHDLDRAAVPVGDEMFLYYGGYARGHKVEPGTERQIGLARMKRDRYMALVPTREEGILVTRPFLVPGGRLTLNVRTMRGMVTTRLLGENGDPLDDLGAVDAAPVEGDELASEVRWPVRPEALRGRTARLEFRLRRAALFGFEFRVRSR